jgi:hypothetical protein
MSQDPEWPCAWSSSTQRHKICVLGQIPPELWLFRSLNRINPPNGVSTFLVRLAERSGSFFRVLVFFDYDIPLVYRFSIAGQLCFHLTRCSWWGIRRRATLFWYRVRCNQIIGGGPAGLQMAMRLHRKALVIDSQEVKSYPRPWLMVVPE